MNNLQRAKVGDALTPRETEILRLVGKGMRSVEIANLLCVSSSTIETHRQVIYKKLHIGSAAEAGAEAQKRGLLS